ncbi:protein-disulfide reductase DsbD family protein [Streptomyces sp. NBC_01264]|uniref:protein-disulfide reductase DsbD family protein n=1 Tax=Streptomyces sp. NBC_01264 TaxID=2903804 RepID=UPI002259DBD6|nr:protein-disulfide reductase DsbD family protein [Streptomyces sp. NBC_01264]MCX4781802.1 protein-disulfide reductase DsbD family protein [Streptomyces sp. NBC_01264]
MIRHAPDARPGTDPKGSPGRAARRCAARAAAGLLLAGTALTGCGQEQDQQPEHPAAVAEFKENGVTVKLSVSDWKASSGTLVATFTPDKPGYHLYSTDLPADGIEGVGRPTEIRVSGTAAASGALQADAAVRTITVPGVDSPVPVYPDGPVTTKLAIRATGAGEAEVAVGYASCSATEGCTIPVAGRKVALRTDTDHVSLTAG